MGFFSKPKPKPAPAPTTGGGSSGGGGAGRSGPTTPAPTPVQAPAPSKNIPAPRGGGGDGSGRPVPIPIIPVEVISIITPSASSSEQTARTLAGGQAGINLAGGGEAARQVTLQEQRDRLMRGYQGIAQRQQIQAEYERLKNPGQRTTLEAYDVTDGRERRTGTRFIEGKEVIGELQGDIDDPAAAFKFFGGASYFPEAKKPREFRTAGGGTFQVTPDNLFYSEGVDSSNQQQSLLVPQQSQSANPFTNLFGGPQSIPLNYREGGMSLTRAEAQRRTKLEMLRAKLNPRGENIVLTGLGIASDFVYEKVPEAFANLYSKRKEILLARTQGKQLNELSNEELAEFGGVKALGFIVKRIEEKAKLDYMNEGESINKGFQREIDTKQVEIQEQVNRGILSVKQGEDLLTRYIEERTPEYDLRIEEAGTRINERATQEASSLYRLSSGTSGLKQNVATSFVFGGALALASRTPIGFAVTTILGIKPTVQFGGQAVKQAKEGDYLGLGIAGVNLAAGYAGVRSFNTLTALRPVGRASPATRDTFVIFQDSVKKKGKGVYEGTVDVKISARYQAQESILGGLWKSDRVLKKVSKQAQYEGVFESTVLGEVSEGVNLVQTKIMRQRTEGSKRPIAYFESFATTTELRAGKPLSLQQKQLLQEAGRATRTQNLFGEIFKAENPRAVNKYSASQGFIKRLTKREAQSGDRPLMTDRQGKGRFKRFSGVSRQTADTFKVEMTNGKQTLTFDPPEGSGKFDLFSKQGNVITQKAEPKINKTSPGRFASSFFPKFREYGLSKSKTPRGKMQRATAYYVKGTGATAEASQAANKGPLRITSIEQPTKSITYDLASDGPQRQQLADPYSQQIASIADSAVQAIIPKQRSLPIQRQAQAPSQMLIPAISARSEVKSQQRSQGTIGAFGIQSRTQVQAPQVGFRIGVDTKQRSANVLVPVARTQLKDDQRTRNRVGTASDIMVGQQTQTAVKTDTALGIGVLTGLAVKQNTRQTTRQQQRVKLREPGFSFGFNFNPSPPPTPRPKTPKIPTKDDDDESSRKKVSGFLVEVKEGGAYRSLIGRPVTRERAINIGASYTDTATARQFRVVETKFKVRAEKKKLVNPIAYKFREFRQNRGSKISLGGSQFIEKSKYSAGPTEQRYLQPRATKVKRQQARSRRSGLGIY